MSKIITSVVGIGFVTAINLMVHTHGFSIMNDARKLACYCGRSIRILFREQHTRKNQSTQHGQQENKVQPAHGFHNSCQARCRTKAIL
jgi:hypothetical protein